MGFPQEPLIEGVRIQFAHLQTLFITIEVRKQDSNISTQIPNYLTTSPTWRREGFRIGDDRNTLEFAFSLGYRLVNCNPFRAHCQAVA